MLPRGAFADDLVGGVSSEFDTFVETDPTCEAAMLDPVLNLDGKIIHTKGFDEVVVGTVAEGLDGGFDGGVAGHEDSHAVESVVAEFADEVDAVFVPEANIGEHEIEVVLSGEGSGVGQVGRLKDGEA